MAKVHVKKDDTVVVTTGINKGKKGKVLEVNSDDSRVLVEGVNIRTKHKKAKNRYQQGGIIKQEVAVHSSNVMIICSKCKEPTKISRIIQEDGSKQRVCKKCQDVIQYGKHNN
ncbi:MAG: 50S ribosomal protein L24 [Bacillota bacterium]